MHPKRSVTSINVHAAKLLGLFIAIDTHNARNMVTLAAPFFLPQRSQQEVIRAVTVSITGGQKSNDVSICLSYRRYNAIRICRPCLDASMISACFRAS